MSIPPSDASGPRRSIDTRLLAVYFAVLTFFFVSGACGLLYQVVWTRKLVLLFGTTSYAVSTVLGIFFAGLGIGSYFGGKLADRTMRPLWWYGVLEIFIGVWALVFILLIDAGEGAAVSMLQATDASRFQGVLLRAVLASVYLIVPVTLMGATLPLLAKYASGEMAVRGRRIGTLYSINTFGAVAGAVAAGFFFVPAWGYTLTTLVGAAANGAVGVLGMVIGKRPGFVTGILRTPDRTGPDLIHAGEGSRPAVLAVTSAFALSGFCAIALEVLWTRLLVLIFTGTTYAYTIMLASMLCGIALGSALAAPFVDRVRRPMAWFGVVLMMNGAASIAILAAFAVLPERFGEWAGSVGFAWDQLLRIQFLLAFLTLLFPTLLFGVGFPLAVRASTAAQGAIGRDVGRLYSANTFAGVAGAVAGGFVIIPALGTHYGIVALSILLALGGVFVLACCPATQASRKLMLSGLGLIALLASYLVAPADVSLALNKSYLPKGEVLVDYREGVEGTVAVAEPADFSEGTSRTIYINRVQATATIERGLKMNRFQGVLPFIFDREFENALFMCFGSGSTLGMLGQWDFDYIDAVEISPDVVDFAHYFDRDNLEVRNNPKVRFHIDDGRNFLLRSRDQYDLITFEPMPLALAGVSTFYTQEYYELCLSHLTYGGIVSQWIPLHSLDIDIVRSLARTFTEVFPYYAAWFVNADLFLTGSNEPLSIDFRRLAQRLQMAHIQAALKPVDLHDPIELLSLFCMGQDTLDRFVEGGRIMRDDLPWAEFVAPRIMQTYKVDVALERLQPYVESVADLVHFESMTVQQARDAESALSRRFASKRTGFNGLIEMRRGGIFSEPELAFMEALELDPDNLHARYYMKDILTQKISQFLRWGDDDYMALASAALQRAIGLVPDEPAYRLMYGDVLYAQGDIDAAHGQYRRYLRLGGTEPRVEERLAEAAGP